MNFSSWSSYEIDNVLDSAFQPPVKGLNNATARYYRKYLFQKLLSAFNWTIPETWSRDYFQFMLYAYGYVAVFDSGVADFGVIPQRCGLAGLNVFYMPTRAIINNPLLPDVSELRINEQCTVLKINPNYTGVLDIVDYYAVKMAMISADIESNLFNSKLSYVFAVENQTAANTVKKLYDQIAQGTPAVVVDKNLMKEDGSAAWQVFQQNIKQNYIVSDLLQDMRRIENDFCSKIGIPTTNTEKRERMSESEVTRNDVETESLIDGWLQRLDDEIIKTNELFPGLNLKVEKRWNTDAGNVVNPGAV